MKTLAAVLVETGRPLELVDLDVPVLLPGQVLVRIACTGVCHTQILETRGYRGEDRFLPHCLGHEASGVVLETSSGVSSRRAGERVVLSWMKGRGADVPGCAYRWQGRTVNAGGVTTFQQLAVVSENRLTPLPDGVSDREGALLGCAIPTGFGAVWNTAQALHGQSVMVVGTGGIGLAAVAAAAARSASPLIAVDMKDDRLELARQFGATNCIHAGEGAVEEKVRALCPQGVDLVIEATGRTEVMEQALSLARSRGGTVVIVGNARHGQSLSVDPRELNQGKRLLGTWGGDNDPDRDFPKYAQLLVDRQLNLAPLIPKVYPLSEINQALQDLETGQVPRPLVELE